VHWSDLLGSPAAEAVFVRHVDTLEELLNVCEALVVHDAPHGLG
jgi:hypothetical protein